MIFCVFQGNRGKSEASAKREFPNLPSHATRLALASPSPLFPRNTQKNHACSAGYGLTEPHTHPRKFQSLLWGSMDIFWNCTIYAQYTPLYVIFSTVFSVFEYPDETLSLVFDIIFFITSGLNKISSMKTLLFILDIL